MWTTCSASRAVRSRSERTTLSPCEPFQQHKAHGLQPVAVDPSQAGEQLNEADKRMAPPENDLGQLVTSGGCHAPASVYPHRPPGPPARLRPPPAPPRPDRPRPEDH